MHKRQSLKYYRLSETSWKIHKNIALWFNNNSQGFLLMLVESFKPENFPFFPQRIFRHTFPRVCAKSTQKLACYFFEYARWILIGTNSWRHKIFSWLGFSDGFSRRMKLEPKKPDALAGYFNRSPLRTSSQSKTVPLTKNWACGPQLELFSFSIGSFRS